jgi:glucose/mannose-6-phosphate isomerase
MNLDNVKQIKNLDPAKVGESIELLPSQMNQVLDESYLIKIPKEYKNINRIVINGMGGSNLGARIIKYALMDTLKVPLIIEPGYDIPGYVDKNTLYIISSYSGTTEEPLSVYKEVKKRGAKILGITEDSPSSKLKKLMIQNNIPGYVFNPAKNICGQPRVGVGYTIFGTLMLISKCGYLKIGEKEIKKYIADMEMLGKKLKPEEKSSLNDAKKIALNIYGRIPILIGAEFVSGNLHAFRNQLNESSKSFAAYLTLPELNHYTMEGLANPKSNKNNLIFVFFDSLLYRPMIQKRSKLTKEVAKQNKIEIIDYQLKAKSKFGQALELLQLGSWISYYLGILYKVDPVKIPYVDWFKKQLK